MCWSFAFQELNKGMERRLADYDKYRRIMAMRADHHFRIIGLAKNFLASMVFNHDIETLILKVRQSLKNVNYISTGMAASYSILIGVTHIFKGVPLIRTIYF